jgi:glycosyltransferase involved in cell wall biosynthesis
MKQNPTISAIIPVYNSAATVGRAIDSVLAQTYAVSEVCVVDDGSTDDIAAVVAQYSAPVFLVRRDNGGPAAARNTAAKATTGEWIALLDADDSWLPRKLEKQLAYMGNPAVGIVDCWTSDVVPELMPQAPVTFETLWQRNMITASSALIRRAAFDQVGGFDEDRALIAVEDYNLWLRITFAGWQAATCPTGLLKYTRARGSLSSQVERFAQAEMTNVARIAACLGLDPARAAAKRLAICDEYGRALFYARRMVAARTLLTEPLRRQPSLSRLAWWLATFLPMPAAAIPNAPHAL